MSRKKNELYPSVLVELLEKPKSSAISVRFEDGRTGKLILGSRGGGKIKPEDAVKWLEERAVLYAKENLVRKEYENLKGDKDFKNGVMKTLTENDPSLSDDLMALMEKVDIELKEAAKRIVIERYVPKPGDVYRVGGKFSASDKGVFLFANVIPKDLKPSTGGMYVHSTDIEQIPVSVRVKKTKDGTPRVSVIVDNTLVDGDKYAHYMKYSADTMVNASRKDESGKIRPTSYAPKIYVTDDALYKKLRPYVDAVNKPRSVEDYVKGMEGLIEHILSISDEEEYRKFSSSFYMNVPVPNAEKHLYDEENLSKISEALLRTSLAGAKKISKDDVEKAVKEAIESGASIHGVFSARVGGWGFHENSLSMRPVMAMKGMDEIIRRFSEERKKEREPAENKKEVENAQPGD